MGEKSSLIVLICLVLATYSTSLGIEVAPDYDKSVITTVQKGETYRGWIKIRNPNNFPVTVEIRCSNCKISDPRINLSAGATRKVFYEVSFRKPGHHVVQIYVSYVIEGNPRQVITTTIIRNFFVVPKPTNVGLYIMLAILILLVVIDIWAFVTGRKRKKEELDIAKLVDEAYEEIKGGGKK